MPNNGFAWIGTYSAAPPPPSSGIGVDTTHRTYQLELRDDQTFRLVEEGDLTVGVLRGRWIMSSSTSATTAHPTGDQSESFDFITLVPDDGQGLPEFGFIVFPITLRVGDFGIRDPSTLATAAGWRRQ